MSDTIRLGTRKSALALWQAENVQQRLNRAHPDLKVEIVPIVTQGDTAVGPLTEQGGKGLFIKAIEVALADGRADIAVHSIKDLPCPLDERFEFTCVIQRDDPRDAWVHGSGLLPGAAPEGTRVGTGSPRRVAALHRHFKQLKTMPMRGNVGTRLDKIKQGEVDAQILSCSGLDRMGLEDHISLRMDPLKMTPAIGQGAIGMETRRGDAKSQGYLQPLNDPRSVREIELERDLLARLGGDCHSAIGCWVNLGFTDPSLGHLPPPPYALAFVADPDSDRWAEAFVNLKGEGVQPDRFVDLLFDQLKAQGALEILTDGDQA